MKKILVIFEFPGTTAKQYDETIKELLSEGVLPNKGLVFHAAAFNDGTLVVSDVWESEEIFNEFGKKMMPIATKAGIPMTAPKIVPVHNIMP